MVEQVLVNVFPKKNKSKKSQKQYPDQKPLVDLGILAVSNNAERRLISLVNTIAESSPFGKAVLQDAADAGYTLAFENQKDSLGFCDPETKMLVLNPKMNDNTLVATLAHEARHAQQFIHGAEGNFGTYNLKCDVMYNRALEADAETAAAVTCHQIKVFGNNAKPWNKFKEDAPVMAENFLDAMPDAKAPISDKILQKTFNGWYQDEVVVEGYEEGYIQDVMNDAMKDRAEADLPYKGTISSKEIVNQICLNANGECYWADNPGILEEPEKLSLCAASVNTADKFFKLREVRTGMKPDTSYKSMPVRDPENLKGAKNKSLASKKGKSAADVLRQTKIAAQIAGRRAF